MRTTISDKAALSTATSPPRSKNDTTPFSTTRSGPHNLNPGASEEPGAVHSRATRSIVQRRQNLDG